MKDILKLTVAPIISLITIMMGISYLNTYISLTMKAHGFSTLVTGILYSSFYAGMMVGAVYLEKVIIKKGHIRSFSIFAAITCTVIALQSMTNPSILWILFRFISGASCAGIFIVIESWLLLLSTPKNRGSVLSLYMVALYSAQCLGQFGIIAVPITSSMSFNLSLILCSISIIPVCLMKAAAPTLQEAEYLNIFYVLKKLPLAFMGNIASGLILGSFYALGPVYAKNMGFSFMQISLVVAVTIFGGMALQIPIGKLSDIYQRRHIIIFICICLCFISSILGFFGNIPFPLLLLTLFFFGGFAFTLYPMSITYCCDYFSSTGITSITAAALIIFGIGSIIGPIISPFFFLIKDPGGLFIFFSLIAFLLVIYAFWRQHTTPPPAEDNKESYQPHPGTVTKLNDNE